MRPFAACGPRAGRRRPQGRSIGVVRPRRLASVGRRRDAGGGQVPRGRTATVEPQVNDRPDQRSVLRPRRFWRAGRRFRRWPSQSRSHSTGSGRRRRATARQRRLYPSGSPRFLVAWTPVPRPSAFPAFDAAVLGLPVCCRARGTDRNWTRVDRKMSWSPAASSTQQRARVLTDVKARRFAPPPLRGADGLDAGSAHARPDWLLPTMLTHTPPTCCGRRPVQNDALSGDR